MHIFLASVMFYIVIFYENINDSISYFIRFVIDCGYVKQQKYNPSSGMYSLDVVQISRYFSTASCSISLLFLCLLSSYSLQHLVI
jgi:hypothetical protein